ncbi:MAG: TldD/PmbA family protein [Candidatus Omnitrophica bacterium]|nr:TldD/PmbA family protein [Candidatus Omnitrophota bacterium]
MITAEWLKEKLLPLARTKEADKAAIVFMRTCLQVSRFANSLIHQHMQDEDQTVYFRVLKDGRIGIASTNSIDEHNLKEALKRALALAHLRLQVKEKKDIPFFKPVKAAAHLYSEETASLPAQKRAGILQRVFSGGQELGVKFSGNLYNGESTLAVISSEGKINHHRYSLAGMKLIATGAGSSGYAAQANHDIHKLGIENLADTAMKKCLHGLKTETLKPDKYDVILEPAAVAELIQWLNYIGFGAKSVLEETSFLWKKAGRSITGEEVSIYDSGLDPDTFILPFDFEGLSRKKVYLIRKGAAGEPLTDSHYARLLKLKPNGHASFPDDTGGPVGYNLVMEQGKASYDKIVASAKRAILVSRFHYINGFLDTHRALMTGMTRDGTFLIENGIPKSALTNMRFTESVLEAFKRIKYVSRERQTVADHLEGLGSACVPTLYIRDFNFTS